MNKNNTSSMSPQYSREDSILSYICEKKQIKHDDNNTRNYKTHTFIIEHQCPNCDMITVGEPVSRADIICPRCNLVLSAPIPYVSGQKVDYPWGLNI